MVNAIVVNADDLGVSRGATLGIVQAHLEGVVTSASLAPSGVDYQYAVESVRQSCPKLGIGLHFTLSAGKPVSSPSDVPLLVDENGFFKMEFVSLLRSLGLKKSGELLAQIEIELEAQIERLHTDGFKPDHIDSERHVHLIPGIFDKVLNAAERHGIPFVRAGNDFGMSLVRLEHFSPAVLRGGLIKHALLQGLTRLNRRRNKNLNSCDNFASYVFTGRLDMVLKNILQKAPEGVTEIMVHPGIPEESEGVYLANPGLEHYLTLEDRRLELDACLQARQFVEGLNLCCFRSLADQQTSSLHG
jgi:predicted glycoside hydrolase/deacetylase ChbG (UPF0249 family)